MSGVETILKEHSQCNAMVEVANRATILTEREKDGRFRINGFTKFHAGNFCNIEAKCLDLIEHARLIFPQLALNFGTSATRSDVMMEVDSPVVLTGEGQKPL